MLVAHVCLMMRSEAGMGEGAQHGLKLALVVWLLVVSVGDGVVVVGCV